MIIALANILSVIVAYSVSPVSVDTRTITVDDLVTSINSKSDAKFNQIVVGSSQVLIRDSVDAINNPDQMISLAQFWSLSRPCKAIAQRSKIHLFCQTRPAGSDACTHYIYDLSVEFGEKARIVSVMRALGRETDNCAQPMVVVPSGNRK